MKSLFIRLGMLAGILLLVGCTDDKVMDDNKQLVKTLDETVSVPVQANENDYSVPFKISETKSVVLNLNDSAFEKPLTGVRYEVSLWSPKELPDEERLSLDFKVVTDSSLLNVSLGPVQPLVLTDTRDGYLYTLSIDTMFRDYTKEELESLSKERDFQIHLINKGENYVVEAL